MQTIVTMDNRAWCQQDPVKLEVLESLVTTDQIRYLTSVVLFAYIAFAYIKKKQNARNVLQYQRMNHFSSVKYHLSDDKYITIIP